MPYLNAISKRRDEDLYRQLSSVDLSGDTRFLIYQGKTYINFSSNDYMGLRQHPQLIERAKEWMSHYGTGVGASRLATGNILEYESLEQKIADWKGFEAALIMNSGFQCNVSILPALFDKKTLKQEPIIFSDKLIHASMHAGCKAANVKQIRFRHNDMEHLSSLLEKYATSSQPIFILTESVFSMDGDIAPLEVLYALRDKYKAMLIVDEAHACGVFGEYGEGLASKADVVIGTFGKAMGCFGAYVTCSKVIKEYLINMCGGIIYSTGLPPAVLGAIDASIDVIKSLEKDRQHIVYIGKILKNGLRCMGFDYGQSDSQIIPLMLQSAEQAVMVSKKLKESGIWATAIRPPTVPISRIRFTLSAQHTEDDINKLLMVLKKVNL